MTLKGILLCFGSNDALFSVKHFNYASFSSINFSRPNPDRSLLNLFRLWVVLVWTVLSPLHPQSELSSPRALIILVWISLPGSCGHVWIPCLCTSRSQLSVCWCCVTFSIILSFQGHKPVRHREASPNDDQRQICSSDPLIRSHSCKQRSASQIITAGHEGSMYLFFWMS